VVRVDREAGVDHCQRKNQLRRRVI
jgi:hypothetical protein